MARKASRTTMRGLGVISLGLKCNQRTIQSECKLLNNMHINRDRLCSKYRTIAFFRLLVWWELPKS